MNSLFSYRSSLMRCLVKPNYYDISIVLQEGHHQWHSQWGRGHIPILQTTCCRNMCSFKRKMYHNRFRPGSAPDPAGRAYGVRCSYSAGEGDPSPFSSPSTPLQCSICRRGWQGLTPPLDEDDLPSGGRKVWSGVGFSLTENMGQKMLHFSYC